MAFDVRTTLAKVAPIVLGLMAVAAFAMGIVLQMRLNERHAALGEIYLAGPPAPVTLDRFDPARDTGPLGEARVTALLDLDAARRLGPVSAGGPTALAVPLRASPQAEAGSGLAIFVMNDPARITRETLAAVAGSRTDAMPILTLNGTIRPAGAWQRALAASDLATFAAAGPVVFPFVEGRRAALLPPDYGQPTAVRTWSWIGGVLGALGLLAVAARLRDSRRRDDDSGDTPESATLAPSTLPDPPEAPGSRTDNNVPHRRTPTRAILLGLALAFIGAASLLAIPGLSARFGVTAPSTPGIGAWAAARWQAALSGDLRAILVLVMGTGAVIALALKVTVDTLRRPAAS